ncbi:peptidoglycan DD-metalloendopeptidase family protein [Patescibacteria group bacterium]|nr:peptidoglycan DD-metalloendopeptidase family protein [Patescibacteria group bacterium]
MTRKGIVLCVLAAFAVAVLDVSAVSAASSDVDSLNTEIQKRQDRVKEIDSLIKSYNEKINERRSEAQSLENQIILLENRIKEKELSVERSRIEIESLTLELQLLGGEIESKELRIGKQKELIAVLIRSIHEKDSVSTFDVLLTRPTLSGFFAELEDLKKLERDLGSTLDRVKEVKRDLEEKKKNREAKQQAVKAEQSRLKKEQLALQGEKNYKESLIAETKDKEQEFKSILYELKQQQQVTQSTISDLEKRLAEKLKSVDDVLARGDYFLNWPIYPSRGITAIFHDPTYPFRHLFEHSGVDIRAAVGTDVKSAGGGYVAWNKTGRMYGNYTMIVHPGGIATVYAHLSKFLAQPDTYVERGDSIALSGGMPGAPGAGFSNGPHLHFEVRQNGIPVEPEGFLPAVPNDFYDYYDDYKRLGVRL